MNALQKAVARLKELMAELAAFDGKEDLTAEELTAIEAKTTEVEALERKIEVLRASEQARARQAKPAADVVTDETAPAAPEKKITPEQQISLAAAATLKSKVTNVPVLKILEDEGYAGYAKLLGDAAKTRNSPNVSQVDTGVASVFLPDVVSSPYIDLLRPTTTFFQGGPRRVEFTHGKYKVGRLAVGASASYVGEAGRKPITNPEFDFVSMAAKKLAAIVPITMEARNWSMTNLETAIRTDLRKKFAIATDLHAYFGTGAGDSPVGILNIANVASFAASGYSADPNNPTIVNVDAAAAALILSLTTSNVPMSESWAWVMSHRTKQYLADMRVGDTTGVYAYPEIRSNTAPSWKGIRVLVSNQVADNGGGTGDESTLALVDFSEVLYAEEGGMEIKTSDQATLFDGTNTIYLWQQNMFGILAEVQHDWTLEHIEAVAKLTGVRWGSNVGSP